MAPVVTTKQEPAELDLLTEVNAHVHEAARRFEGVEPGPDRWEFRCECGATDCRETVSLTLADYETHRAEGQPRAGSRTPEARLEST